MIMPDGPTGAVCLYRKVSGVWSDCTLIKSPMNYFNPSSPSFGISVGLSGDGSMLAVGAPGTSSGGKENKQEVETNLQTKKMYVKTDDVC